MCYQRLFWGFSLILLSLTLNVHGQDVFDRLQSSYDYASQAKSNVDDCFDYLKKAIQENNLEDFKYYIRKAKNEIEDAQTNADEAESAADLDGILYSTCNEVTDEAAESKNNFYAAKSAFDDAYSCFRRIEYSSDSDEIAYYYRKSLSYIDDGLSELERGQDNLVAAVEYLNNCR
jgi:flagellar hook-basal body complex protein FliE